MKILVIGSTGLIGSRFVELHNKNFEIDSPTHAAMDIVDPLSLSNYLESSNAEVVLNFSGFTDVDGAEEEKGDMNGLCYKLNVLAVHNLAKICKDLNKHLIQLSTGYIFNGKKDDAPYKEGEKGNPVNWYGQTKYMGEQGVISGRGSYTIARIEMPYSSSFGKKKDIGRIFLEMLKSGKEISGIVDQKITPVFVDDAVNAISKLAEKKAQGIYNVVSIDFTSPYDFALKIAENIGADKNLVKKAKFADFEKSRKAKRPQNTWLDTTKFESEFGKGILHTNDEGIKRFLEKIT